jgi:hypothetical protein
VAKPAPTALTMSALQAPTELTERLELPVLPGQMTSSRTARLARPAAEPADRAEMLLGPMAARVVRGVTAHRVVQEHRLLAATGIPAFYLIRPAI